MKVIEGKVLLKIIPLPEMTQKTDSGLVLFDTPNQGIEQGEVIEVGSDISEISKGDKVLIYMNSGTTFTHPETEEKFRSISKSEIIVIL